MKSLVLALCVWTCFAHAAIIDKKDFPDEVSVGATKLVLNGGGMRKKWVVIKNVDVYVGALYLPAKSSDAAAIMASPAPKVLDMVFARDISQKRIRDSWQESFDKVCASDCEAVKEPLKAFLDFISDVEENDRMKFTIEKDSVKVDLKVKKGDKTATIMGEAFRKVLLNIYLGDKTTAPELKPKLLGL